jgi:hypothetical protein
VITLYFDGDAGKRLIHELGLRAHRRTGGGGFHVDFKHPGWRVKTFSSSTMRPGHRFAGMDVRGDGGYAIVLGESSRGRYQWLRGPQPDDIDVLPEELKNALRANPVLSSQTYDEPFNELLKRALAKAETDGRNASLVWLGCQLRDNACEFSLAYAIARQFAATVGVKNTKGEFEPFTISEAEDVIASLYRSSPRAPSWRTSRASEDESFNIGKQHST